MMDAQTKIVIRVLLYNDGKKKMLVHSKLRTELITHGYHHWVVYVDAERV
jgi:hypothetical protein